MPTPETDLCRLSVAEAADLIRARRLSSVEYTSALLARIAAFDGQLDAFITLTADLALEQAHAADQEIARSGPRGPLHGIPFGAKDIFDTAGILTSGHSRVCLDRVPTRDATAVRLLRAGGAVLLGKLATHEFAHGGPSFDLPWPPARNPWNTACYPGGSSSGAGAGLAAGFMPLALGSDTGGSIRGPASWCGITGLMPSFGLVSRAGVIPNSFTFDHCGPMARSAEDCAIALQALAAFDPADSGSVRTAVPDYRAALTGELRGLRIGALRHLGEEDLPAAPETLAAFDEALRVLRGLGATIGTARWPGPRACVDIKVVIAESEIFTIHRAALQTRPQDFGWDFLQRALPACLFGAADYVTATRAHRRMALRMAEAFESFDVLVSVGQGPAPRLDAHDPMGFWRNADLFVPANLAAGPAMVVGDGFSSGGLPLGLQIVGRPFGDATVLRVGHAFQQATGWHRRMPVLDPQAVAAPLAPPALPVAAPDCPPALRALCDTMAARAGLRLHERDRVLLERAAPHALEMLGRLHADHGFGDMPANAFRFPEAGG